VIKGERRYRKESKKGEEIQSGEKTRAKYRVIKG
jgi:hypothetical protein